MATVYSDSGTLSSSSRLFRAALTYSTSESNTAVTISWTATAQMYNAYQYGVKIACESKSDTGVCSSSSSYPGNNQWYDVVSISGTTTVSKSTSATTKTLTSTATTQAVSGYGGSYGSESVSASISIPALASYTVAYDANGGSGAPSSQKKYYGKTLTLSTTTPTRENYKFKGWATSSSSTTVAYSAGGFYTANAAATLYAVWEEITPFVISYNANGGSGAPSSQEKSAGVAITLSTTVPTRTNYKFAGWSTSSTATFAPYKAGDTFTVDADVTLYAVWHTTIYDSYDLWLPTSSDVQDLWFQIDDSADISDVYFRTS